MPTVVGTAFTANLNANKIFIDMTYLPDPITHKFWLTIQNQSLSALYFKIVNNIANWTLTTPADGKLGSVGAGATGTFTPILSRAKPASETTDTGSLKIEAYTDSGYTNKIGEASLDVTVYIEDLETWTDVTKYDFNDGTAQGWSGGSVTGEVSVEAGGYSYITPEVGGATADKSISCSITLPNRAKVRLALYLTLKNRNSHASSGFTVSITALTVKVNGTEVFKIPSTFLSVYAAAGTTVYGSPWSKIALDLSAYKNQTVTITITYTLSSPNSSACASAITDRIVVAGKD
jgi:hypothetical protein